MGCETTVESPYKGHHWDSTNGIKWRMLRKLKIRDLINKVTITFLLGNVQIPPPPFGCLFQIVFFKYSLKKYLTHPLTAPPPLFEGIT